jgi:hypothetical protein
LDNFQFAEPPIDALAVVMAIDELRRAAKTFFQTSQHLSFSNIEQKTLKIKEGKENHTKNN